MTKSIYFLILFSSVLTLSYATEQNQTPQEKPGTGAEMPVIVTEEPKQKQNIRPPSFEDFIETEGSDSGQSTPITPRASSLSPEKQITPRGKGRSLKGALEASRNSTTSK
ncbi:MAG TPA: hypothetical protein DIC42_02005 [Holosporales bacterium]|nr:hypothetical protein [Holosporales bacterium]